MNDTFSFRLDRETHQILKFLASSSFRSRGGVLRLLIQYAARHPGCLFSHREDYANARVNDGNDTFAESNFKELSDD